MSKNTIIFILIIISAVQSYILYTNKNEAWLIQSIEHAKQNVKHMVQPSSKSDDLTTEVTTTLSPQADIIESKSETIPSVTTTTTSTPARTITTTTTTSVAFKHLQTNVDCNEKNQPIDQLICEDSELLDQDKRLNFVLQMWSKSLKAVDFKISKQEDWLAQRNIKCAQSNQATLKNCIQSMTESRIQAITGQL